MARPMGHLQCGAYLCWGFLPLQCKVVIIGFVSLLVMRIFVVLISILLFCQERVGGRARDKAPK
jgi:hypothetical protein